MKTKKTKDSVISKNDNIVCQGKIYHVQTEFYKATNKIICNIFKEGTALKKIEKKIDLDKQKDITEEISSLHFYVLNKIEEGCKNLSNQQATITIENATPSNANETKIRKLDEKALQNFLEFEKILDKILASFLNFIEKTDEIESCLILWKFSDVTFEFFLSEHKDSQNVKDNLISLWNKTESFFTKKKKNLNSVELVFNKKILFLTQTNREKHTIISITQLPKNANFAMFKQKSKKFLSELSLIEI